MERERMGQILELLTETNPNSYELRTEGRSLLNGVFRGMISDFDQTTGCIHIVVPSLSMLDPIVARSTMPITQVDVGREVLVVFESSDVRCPYIVGLIWEPEQNPPTQAGPIEAKVDGEQVVIEGKKEIVLKCGKASITLTRAGKVLIRGAYVLSRSSGVNRIKGGSVQVN
ncbi:MAG: DUF6484 domain-containing protein [Nitrospirota bacterium]